jgi:trk system potassium uptake protein
VQVRADGVRLRTVPFAIEPPLRRVSSIVTGALTTAPRHRSSPTPLGTARRRKRVAGRLPAVLAWMQLGAGAVVIAIELALAHPAAWTGRALAAADALVLAIFCARVAMRARRSRASLRDPWLAATVAVGFVLGWWSLRLAAGVALLHEGWRGSSWIRRARGGERLLVNVAQHPSRSLVLSFAGIIAFGSLLLSLPAAAAGQSPAFVDALFTAVSATCVTGLNTVDPATVWSLFGQGVILVLMQVGGIGIMAIAAFVSLAVGGEIGLRRDALLRGAFDEPDAMEMRALVKGIVLWTLSIEAVGALVLFLRFATMMPASRAAGFAVFHSVAAFCNAGFSLFSDNLMAFAADPLVSITIAALITLGGFGFGVLVGLGRLVLAPRQARLSLHARVVLVTSAVLVWAGALAYFLLEFDRSLAHLSLPGKLLASFFQSVTARTAGFNTVDIAQIKPATALVLMVLMFIGASPASTGGGIKTTTFALVSLAIRALVSERDDIEVFGRRIVPAQAMRALALGGATLLTLAGGFGVLLLTEQLDFTKLAFEATSALATVGLSMGTTPQLTTAGRLVVCGLMFLGRVGPLTVVAAASARRHSARLDLPEDRVLVG